MRFSSLLLVVVIAMAGQQLAIEGKRMSTVSFATVKNKLDNPSDEKAEKTIQQAEMIVEALWEHMEAKGCLFGSSLPGSRQDDIAMIWQHELDKTLLDAQGPHSFLASHVPKEVAVLVSAQAAEINRTSTWSEVRIGLLKKKLEEGGFSYDAKRAACIMKSKETLEHMQKLIRDELSQGCGGKCTKMSMVSNECRERGNVCPEGTQCGCSYSTQQKLAATVGPVSYLVYWIAMAKLIPGGAVMPGPLELSMLTTFLISSKAEGCTCVPSPCAWNSEKQSCTPKASPSAKNAFQATIPYLGRKCVLKDDGWRAIPALKGLVDPGCEVRVCMPEDKNKIGTWDKGTYNCQLSFGNSSADAVASFKPLPTRMKDYAEAFYPDMEKHLERQQTQQKPPRVAKEIHRWGESENSREMDELF